MQPLKSARLSSGFMRRCMCRFSHQLRNHQYYRVTSPPLRCLSSKEFDCFQRSQPPASAMRTPFAGRLWRWAEIAGWRFPVNLLSMLHPRIRIYRAERHMYHNNSTHTRRLHHCCRSTVQRCFARCTVASTALLVYRSILLTKSYCSTATKNMI